MCIDRMSIITLSEGHEMLMDSIGSSLIIFLIDHLLLPQICTYKVGSILCHTFYCQLLASESLSAIKEVPEHSMISGSMPHNILSFSTHHYCHEYCHVQVCQLHSLKVEIEPQPGAWSHSLRPNTELQPCKPPMWPRFFVLNRHIYTVMGGPQCCDHL